MLRLIPSRLKGTAFEQYPASKRFAQAEQATHTEAARMIAALAKRNCDAGTPAYRATEVAMADMLQEADALMAAHQGA